MEHGKQSDRKKSGDLYNKTFSLYNILYGLSSRVAHHFTHRKKNSPASDVYTSFAGHRDLQSARSPADGGKASNCDQGKPSHFVQQLLK